MSPEFTDEQLEELRSLLRKWDPISAYDDPTWPPDEYDCVLGPLLALLRRSAPEDEIVAALNNEMENHFALDPNEWIRPERTKRLAVEATAWFVRNRAK